MAIRPVSPILVTRTEAGYILSRCVCCALFFIALLSELQGGLYSLPGILRVYTTLDCALRGSAPGREPVVASRVRGLFSVHRSPAQLQARSWQSDPQSGLVKAVVAPPAAVSLKPLQPRD